MKNILPPKNYIGTSADGFLIARSGQLVALLVFGESEKYTAYVREAPVRLEEDYHRVFGGENWLRIYDDRGLSFQIFAKKIDIYRAGETRCTIVVDDR